MSTTETAKALTRLFSELVHGANHPRGAFMLNSGDIGLLRSLDLLPAGDASRSVSGGATIAAHAQHLRYGLQLMNAWAREGGNPLADARWDEAWKITEVSENEWAEIRHGLNSEAVTWLGVLGDTRDRSALELCGMMGSIAHVAYHMGAVRQIAANARGPKEGTFDH